MKTELWNHLTGDTAITDNVGDRIYWDYAPANPIKPYIVLNLLTSAPDNLLRGTSDYRETNIQIDVIASTGGNSVGVDEIADAVEQRLTGAFIGNLATTVTEMRPIEVTDWDGAGTPPVKGVSIDVTIEQD